MPAMRCHVALTPAEAAAAPLGVVVDVMRATSTIAQALAAGYQRVYCCAEIEHALSLKAELGDEAITGGEREAQRHRGLRRRRLAARVPRAAGGDVVPLHHERHSLDRRGGRGAASRSCSARS